MVRAAQKGEMENPSPEVAEVAATTKRSSVKKFAKTKHKGLPEKKVTKESFNEDYVKELEDGLVKMDYPSYDQVDKLMCKIAKENDIDTTTLHMAFKTKHLMVPDDWAKKKMFEPVVIPKTPEGLNMKEESQDKMLARVRKAQNKIENKEMGIKSSKPITKPTLKKPENKFTNDEPKVEKPKPKLKNPENEFHSEGKSYGLYKGSGKPGGAMKAYLDKKKKEKKQVKEESHSPFTTPELQRKKKIEDFKKNADRVLRGKKSDDGPSIQKEGSLHKWFKGSKSKDGKGGWVNVVTGGTCASDEPGEGTPKCVSSAKRASMTKAERLSAARRKKKADPGQQQKSGAAKPTYVSTDSPRKKKKKKMSEGWSDKYKQSIDCDNPKGFSQKAHCQGRDKMNEESIPFWRSMLDEAMIKGYIEEGSDKPGKGAGKKDACYHKVKARYDVWPSAYASGALAKCRKVGAANWGEGGKKK